MLVSGSGFARSVTWPALEVRLLGEHLRFLENVDFISNAFFFQRCMFIYLYLLEGGGGALRKGKEQFLDLQFPLAARSRIAKYPTCG